MPERIENAMNQERQLSVKSPISTDLMAPPDFSREELIARWQALYGIAPPAKTSQQLLFQAVAYRLQERVEGELKPATRRFLEQVAKNGGKQITTPISARSGTRLLREWHGSTYEATVLDDGVLFQGKKYRSLSEVARAITGVRWSGPLFFGLKKNLKKECPHETTYSPLRCLH